MKIMSQFHELTIKKVSKDTDKAVIISFNVPQNLDEIFAFKAGQYITLKTKIAGKEIRRDYSLCVSPKSNELKVAIKKVENGLFSVYANTLLKANDVLEVAPPKGRFVFEPIKSTARIIVGFATGSGITPIMSIIKTVLEEEPLSKFILIYGNKTPKDTIFYAELLDLNLKYPNQFNFEFVFSQSDEENALFGRIEKNTVKYFIENKYKGIIVDAFYLCGQEAMITAVSEVLQEYDIRKSNIHFELFKVSAPTDTVKNTVDGSTKITVIIKKKELLFTMSQKSTILEAALDEGIDAPYSCQGGICSSCIARLTEGEANMLHNNILTDSDIDEGLILTCQAQPITPTIVVDYNF
tara:strand:- start:215 stop:1273 length:1059 start_codon:yes stop_codon:yes gene_type:complete